MFETLLETTTAGSNLAGSPRKGLVVDGVEEVTDIAAADIETSPGFGAQNSTAYITGMAKLKGIVKTLSTLIELWLLQLTR